MNQFFAIFCGILLINHEADGTHNRKRTRHRLTSTENPTPSLSSDKKAGCHHDIFATSGMISFPGYHEDYPSKLQECFWHIHASQNSTATLQFRIFDLPKQDNNSRCSNGYVQYGTFTEENLQLILSGRLCGSQIPIACKARGSIWVAVMSGVHSVADARNFEGFEAYFKTFKDFKSKEKPEGRRKNWRRGRGGWVNTTAIVASVCGVVPLLVIAILVFFYCKRKQRSKRILNISRTSNININQRAPESYMVPTGHDLCTRYSENHIYEEMPTSQNMPNDNQYVRRPSRSSTVFENQDNQDSFPQAVAPDIVHVIFTPKSRAASYLSFDTTTPDISTSRDRIISRSSVQSVVPNSGAASTSHIVTNVDLKQVQNRYVSGPNSIPRIVVAMVNSDTDKEKSASMPEGLDIRKGAFSTTHTATKQIENELNTTSNSKNTDLKFRHSSCVNNNNNSKENVNLNMEPLTKPLKSTNSVQNDAFPCDSRSSEDLCEVDDVFYDSPNEPHYFNINTNLDDIAIVNKSCNCSHSCDCIEMTSFCMDPPSVPPNTPVDGVRTVYDPRRYLLSLPCWIGRKKSDFK